MTGLQHLRARAAVLALALAAACTPAPECSADTDCPGEETCAADGHCGAEVTPDEDAGPDDDAGTPDELEVTLTANVTTVTAGSDVTLSWTTHPVADVCTLYVQTAFDTSRGEVFGAPTSGASSFTAQPEQDSEFTIECTSDDVTDEASVSVDVTATGDLSADPAQVNGDTPSELSWETTGVSDCELTGPSSFAFDIPSADIESGSTSLTAPVAGEYTLVCEGDELDSVTIEVARVSIDEVTPAALGPTAVEVTLSYTYVGPDGDSCVVLANDVAAPDEQAAEAGHQVTVSATTTLKVECDGYAGATLSASTLVEQLITSFTGPTDALDYGADAALAFDVAEGVTCTLGGVVVTSPHNLAVTASGEHELTCTKGELSATATVAVSVRPGFVGEGLTGTLTKAAAADPEADVVLLATPTLNASACSVSASHFAEPAAMTLSSTEADHQVFELVVKRGTNGPATDEVVTYTVACESDGPDVSAASSAEAVVWWGGLTVANLGDFATSAATLVTTDVSLTGAVDVSQLSSLLEVGDALSIQGTTLIRIEGLESLERLHGSLQVLSNPTLEELSGGGGARGLVALRVVAGDVTVGVATFGNSALEDVILPALETIGGGLTISSNEDLKEISIGALLSVGGGLTIESNRVGTNPSQLDTIDLRSLATIASDGGGFVLKHTSLDELMTLSTEGYEPFGSLISVGTGHAEEEFDVQVNPGLDCTEINDAYCALEPRPGTPNLRGGATNDQCSTTCPTP